LSEWKLRYIDNDIVLKSWVQDYETFGLLGSVKLGTLGLVVGEGVLGVGGA